MILHHRFFDDTTTYLTFAQIRSALAAQPANAIRMELTQLVSQRDVEQRTETREKSTFAGIAIQGGATYEVALDGYRISKSGLIKVDRFEDEFYAKLQRDLALDELTLPAGSEGDLWEPIPLDGSDEAQRRAVEKLDDVIEKLRGDNGYAATRPEEKTFILDKLSMAARRLKEDKQITWMYLNEFALKPLGALIQQFGKAAIGVAALVAKDSLLNWLKSKGFSILDGLVK
ncbi:hypothetical protein [Bradyrhizobium sp. SZCCHNS1012]|nr:hypothetical protein [Bradyrhizobium sp. SZCCHNS1012]